MSVADKTSVRYPVKAANSSAQRDRALRAGRRRHAERYLDGVTFSQSAMLMGNVDILERRVTTSNIGSLELVAAIELKGSLCCASKLHVV